MSDNPFTYGNPIVDPARFVGREGELGQILTRLRNDAFESSAVVGERRIGKSSLLNALETGDLGLGRDAAICLLSLDPQMLSSQATPHRFWERVLRQLVHKLPDGELKVAVEELRRAESVDTFDLSDLFDRLDDAGLSVVLLLDEFERVAGNANFGPDFFYGLRALAIRHRLALVTASYAELSSLSHSDDVRASPFFNIFATIHLGPFKPEEAAALFERYLAGTGVEFQDGERVFLASIAGTHPFYLQIGGAFLFEAYQQGVSAEERLSYTRRRFATEAEDTLEHAWRHSTDEERISMLLLALLGGPGGGTPESAGIPVAGAKRASQRVVRTALRQLLITHFDEGELRALCFDLNVEYDDLPGEGRANRVVGLIRYLERRGRIPELVATGTRQRPDVPWETLSPAEGSAQATLQLLSLPLAPLFGIDRLTEYYSHAGPALARLARRGLVIEQDGGYALFSTVLVEWIRNELQATAPPSNYREWLRDPANQRRVGQIRSDLAYDVTERVLPGFKEAYWELVAGWLANPATIEPAIDLLRSWLG